MKNELLEKIKQEVAQENEFTSYQAMSNHLKEKRYLLEQINDEIAHRYAKEFAKQGEREHQIALAEAQLLGFDHGRKGYDIKDLVSAMGLEADEWKTLKKEHSLYYLSDIDKDEIDELLKSEQ